MEKGVKLVSMKKKVTRGVVLASCFVLMLAFCVGCGAKEEFVAIGSSDNGAIELSVNNTTGKTVTEVSAKTSAGTEYKALSFEEGSTSWEADKKAHIYIQPTDFGASQSSGSFDFRLTCSDGTIMTLHAVDVDTLKEVGDLTLAYDKSEALGYLTYTDKNGSAVNTLESEKSVVATEKAAKEATEAQAKADAEAKAQAEAKAKAQAEAEAQAQAAASASASVAAAQTADTGTTSSSDGYSYDSSSSDSSDSSSSGSGASQTEDQCVAGGVKLRE